MQPIGRRLAEWNFQLLAFGVSAAAAFIVPSTGELKNAALANLGTLVGALCFLVGAILLLPERTRTAEAA